MATRNERERQREAEREQRTRPNTITPSWKAAAGQSRLGLRNLQFDITGDGALNRRRLLQDITLAGLPPEQEDMLLKQASSQADQIIDRRFKEQEQAQANVVRDFQIGQFRRDSEQRDTLEPLLFSINQEASSILNSEEPIDVRQTKLNELMTRRPEMMRNEAYVKVFEPYNKALKNELASNEMMSYNNPELNTVISSLKSLAANGDVEGVKELVEEYPQFKRLQNQYVILAESERDKPNKAGNLAKIELQSNTAALETFEKVIAGESDLNPSRLTLEANKIIQKAIAQGIKIPEIISRVEVSGWSEEQWKSESRDYVSELISLIKKVIDVADKQGGPTERKLRTVDQLRNINSSDIRNQEVEDEE